MRTVLNKAFCNRQDRLDVMKCTKGVLSSEQLSILLTSLRWEAVDKLFPWSTELPEDFKVTKIKEDKGYRLFLRFYNYYYLLYFQGTDVQLSLT